MNKIIVDTEILNLDILEDLFLIINHDCTINLNIKNNNKLKLLINNSSIKVNINLLENSSLTINNLGIDSSISYNVVSNDNSNLLVVDSILSEIDSINDININHKGNNINTKFYTNGINLDNNKLYFNINGILDKTCLNNNLLENSKIINIKDGDSKIIPNLIIDTKEVIANHSAFIGTFNNDDLNYLMSRGINNLDAKNLLIKSILLSNMEDDKEEFIKEIYKKLNRG